MEIRTDEEVLEWHKNTLENGKVSEETIKREDLKFFKISPDAAKDKKRFKIEVEDFVTKHKNMLRKMEKDCLKESGGLSNLFLLILGRISKTTASARKNS